MVRGVRARLTVTIVALVVLTAAVLGLGAALVLDVTLHDRFRDDAAAQAAFDLSEIIPPRLPQAAPTIADLETSGLPATLDRRDVEAIVDLGAEGVYATAGLGSLTGALDGLRTTLGPVVDDGRIGYAWTRIGERPVLVVAGRSAGTGPAFYFVHDATTLEGTLGQLRLALGGGTLILAAIGLIVARLVARGVLAPVEAAGRAAERIERGDLSARVPVTSDDEFGAWAERFNRMAGSLQETIGRLEASQAQNRRFVADVSHELRTPVAALVAEASILRQHLDALPAESRRAGELVVDDVGRLRQLVEELMELSRFDAEAEEPALEPVDLNRLVAEVVERRLPAASVERAEPPVIVQSDPRRLERILANLLGNAAEHAPGAPVEVTVEPVGAWVEVRVADRGPGVPADRLARIFDRFYMADPSRRGGSGLGLAIAAEHAELLGGRLEAGPHEGGGLVVTLALPVTGS